MTAVARRFAFALSFACTGAALAAAPAPAALPAPQAAAASGLSGQVLETQAAGPYTYLRLKTAAGEVWAAVPATTVKQGAQVTLVGTSLMQNFQSRTLNKTFDKIWFGSLAEGSGGAGGAKAGGMPSSMLGMPGAPGMSPNAAPAAPAAPDVKVPKASGPDARTVAEVVSGKGKLNDKTVLVQARVVKVNNGIMGKNWLHLRDGSGAAADGSNDILVTTKDSAKVGDVVLARGKVKTNVDLGSGYSYEVIIEGAALTAK